MSLLVLIYVHGLVEFSRIPALCVYKLKLLFAYSEIQKMHQTFFAFVVNFCVTECLQNSLRFFFLQVFC